MKSESKSLNVSEMKEDIRNIIAESYREKNAPDATSRFNISQYVEHLLATTKTPALTSFLMRVDESIKQGVPQFMLFEQFGDGLKQFSDIIEVSKVITMMNETMSQEGSAQILECFTIAEKIKDEYVHEQLCEALNAYFATPNDITKDMVKEALDNVHNLNMSKDAVRISLIVENIEEANPVYFAKESINESAALVRRQERSRDEQIQKNIYDKVEKYIEKRLNEDAEAKKALSEQYTISNISNKMGLYDTIQGLMVTEAAKSNKKLSAKLEQFADAIRQGCYEERIYESFVQQITPFNYLKPVEKVINKINEKANENPDALLLTRILEEMSEAADSYLYREMVEEDVCRFITTPTPENRIQALNACMPYAANRYVNKILETIYKISDKRNPLSISESALSIRDQISMIKENVSVYNMYSPVLYIKENQSVFAVGNTFYLKNGNTIAPLAKQYIPKLDEKFVQLAHLVNDPRVNIVEDRIYLSGEELWATIFEDRVIISDGHSENKEDATSLRRLNEMCLKYGTYGNTEFFIMASCLIENFNNIAPLGFAKRVVMNSNQEVSCELFRLDENIFLAVHNSAIHQNTFFKNVNPIFARNTINEHFGINVSQLFEDLLPDQNKIMIQLFETKSEYEKSIEEYEQMIQELTDAKENATTTEIEKELDDAIADAEKKLEDVKKEFRQWQDTAEETMEGAKDEDDDDNVTTEVSNEPLDKDEVEDHKEEMSQPLSSDAAEEVAPAEEAGSEVPVVTDDEFSEFLATDASDDEANPDEIESDDDFVSAESPAESPAEDAPEHEVTDTVAMTDTDDEEEIGDDIYAEVPNEEIPSDEDILTATEEPAAEDIYQEEGDMDVIDAETGEDAAGTEATDLFGGDTEDPLGTGKEIDNELYNPNTQTSEFNIVNVMFDENVKEGTIMKSGSVLALKPMVDADGRKYIDEVLVKFYLGSDNTPVIQSDEAMSTAMYGAIVNAITSHPSYSNVCENGLDIVTGSAVPGDEAVAAIQPDLNADDEKWEEEYNADGNAEDRGIFDVTVGEPAKEIAVATEEPAAEETPVDLAIEDLFADEEPTEEIAVATEEPAVAAPAAPAETEIVNGDPAVIAPAAEEPVAVAEVPAEDPVDTYTDVDGTEIEVPAPAADEQPAEDGEEKPEDEEDETIIPESHARKVTAEQINENRKSILSIKSKVVK